MLHSLILSIERWFSPSAHCLPNTACVNLERTSKSQMASLVNSLKQQTDIVVVSLHQGLENIPYVERSCRKLTLQLVDAGADCLVCHHPHVIQGIEMYKDVPIFHSIGNFVIDLDFQRRPSARESLALRVLLYKKKLHKIVIDPFLIDDTLQPRLATHQEKERIRTKTEALSSTFQSEVWSTINHLKCGWLKSLSRLYGLYEMMQHHGISTSAVYYFNRIAEKLKPGP